MKDIIIVGAGLFGSVLAERITSQLNIPVTIIDKRSHIGGNCWSEIDDETGIEIHKYGPHVFHTDEKIVWEYISKFTKFDNFQLHVWTRYKGKTYSLPVNLATINSFYDKNFSPNEAQEFIKNEADKEKIDNPKNLEEKAISLIGRPLYEAFFKGYTLKQWEKDPKELPADIINRLPVRFNYNSRYFNDFYEGIPSDGYAALFKKLLANQLINIHLGCDWNDFKESIKHDVFIIFTGPIDQYFDFKYGKLEWRTVNFESKVFYIDDWQGAPMVNFADPSIKWTRSTEYKHFQKKFKNKNTIVFFETSSTAQSDDDPYYPISTIRNLEILKKYQEEANQSQNVLFGGRLGSYKYYDMDDTIFNALKIFNSDAIQNRLKSIK